MTPKEKAEDLVHQYRMLLMNEGENYAEEIIVSMLSKKCALIAIEEMIRIAPFGGNRDVQIEDGSKEFYMNVKQEIEKL